MPEQISIEIQARNRLDALYEAAEALDGLDGESRKLIGSLKDLSKGSSDVEKLASAYEDLQRRIEAARSKGDEASRKQIRQFEQEANKLKAAGKALQTLQKSGADSWSQQMKQLQDQLKFTSGPLMGEMPTEYRAIFEAMEKAGKKAPAEEAARTAFMGTMGTESVTQSIQQLMEEDREFRDRMAEEERSRARWRRTIGTIGGLALGGGVVAAGMKAVSVWKEINTELVKTEAMFGGVEDRLFGIGNKLGFTKRQMLELNRTSGMFVNQFMPEQIKQLMAYSRVRGISPMSGLGLGAVTQLTGLEFKSPEAKKGATSAEIKAAREAAAPGLAFLGRMTKEMQRVGMEQMRQAEFIRNLVDLQRQHAEVTVGPGAFMPFGVSKMLQDVFGPESERGRLGALGMSFASRLQASLTAEDPKLDALRMQYYGVGKPGGMSLWEYQKVRSKGMWGRGLGLDIGMIEEMTRGRGQEAQYMAARMVFPQLKPEEIEKIWQNRNAFRLGTEKENKALAEKLGIGSVKDLRSDLAKRMEDYVSKGERLAVATEKLQYAFGEKMGPALLGVMTQVYDKMGDLIESNSLLTIGMAGLGLGLVGKTAGAGSSFLGGLFGGGAAAKLFGAGGAKGATAVTAAQAEMFGTSILRSLGITVGGAATAGITAAGGIYLATKEILKRDEKKEYKEGGLYQVEGMGLARFKNGKFEPLRQDVGQLPSMTVTAKHPQAWMETFRGAPESIADWARMPVPEKPKKGKGDVNVNVQAILNVKPSEVDMEEVARESGAKVEAAILEEYRTMQGGIGYHVFPHRRAD